MQLVPTIDKMPTSTVTLLAARNVIALQTNSSLI